LTGNDDASHNHAELTYRGITGGGVFFLGTLVLSRSFVQDQVADSSCECEYYAYSTGVKDMEYVRLLIRDLAGLSLGLPAIPTMYVDCEPAIAVAINLLRVLLHVRAPNISILKSGYVGTMFVVS
jgi:hypothetical protein